MTFTLPDLPFAKDALSPHISKETIEFHYGKHHAGYVNKLNAATDGKDEAKMTLEEIIAKAGPGGMFNCAAQTWNHTFYWNSLSPNGGGAPSGKLAEAINDAFGDFDKFKTEFTSVAAGHFGSGWAWLVYNTDSKKLEAVGTHDAGTPLTAGNQVPIVTCDVWEHAYYVDYRNNRGAYIEAWWKLINWEFAAANFEKASA